MENKEREFDDTSSESTSTESDENPELNQFERPVKRSKISLILHSFLEIKSVLALKHIIEEDYTEWNGGVMNSINAPIKPLRKQ